MSWDKVGNDIEKGPFGLFKWIAIFAVMFTLIFGGIAWITKPASMAVDRIVTKNSFQYKEGMEQRAAILKANLVEIDAELASGADNPQELRKQRMIISAQLKAITINE